MKSYVVAGLIVAVLTAQHAVADQDQISTQKIDENSFEITLLSKSVFDVAGATRRILPTAKSLCGELNVDLGRYRFEQSESVTGSKAEDWFKLVQQLKCVAAASQKAAQPRTPQLADDKAIEAVRNRVRELSGQHFDNMYSNLGEDASAGLQMLKDSPGRNSTSNSPTAAGTQIDIDLYRITVYDNPANAPSSGIYVAVDYDNRVGNVAHHCGYLMWHSFDAEEFKLGRIETGVLEEALTAKLSDDEIYATRKKLRCANFYDK